MLDKIKKNLLIKPEGANSDGSYTFGASLSHGEIKIKVKKDVFDNMDEMERFQSSLNSMLDDFKDKFLIKK